MAHRFLIVDDDPQVSEALAALLSLDGYAVMTASNGQEALDVITQLRPSLVFLDLNMPVMDGWAFMRALREKQLHLPVIVMSSDHRVGQWAKELDVVAYLSKPFGLAHLLDTVHLLLDHRIAEPED